MPQIIQENKQIQALNEINEQLSVISAINASLSGRCSYCIVAISGDGQSLNKILVDERDQSKISSILNGQRGRLIKSVQGKAEKFRISLDKTDRDILEGKSVIQRPRNRKRNREDGAVPTDKEMDGEEISNSDNGADPPASTDEETGSSEDDDTGL